MKKFILQSIVLFSAIGISLYYLHSIWQPEVVKKEHERIRNMKDIVSQNRKHDFMITGTSHAWSINKNINDLVGDHFNKSGNSLYYDLQNYLYLKPYLNDSCIIILSISYFSFGIDENRTDKGEDNSFENEFYGYLPRSAIYNYRLAKECRIIKNKCQDIFFRKGKKILNIKDKKIEKVEKKKKTELDSVTTLKWRTKYIKRHGGMRAKQHLKIGEYSDIEPNVAYLSALVEDAKKSGFRPILITPPYNNAYNKHFSKEWLTTQFYEPIFRIKNKYDIPYLDYSSLEGVSDRFDMFLDSDHIKPAKNHIFNAIFQEDLRKLNYIE